MRYGVRPIGSTFTSLAVMFALVCVAVTAGGMTPSTSTVSVTCATDSIASTDAVAPSGSSAVRSVGLRPSFANRTVYVPGGRLGSE